MAQMPSRSVSPVATFRYGKRQLDGDWSASSRALTRDVSVTTARERSALVIDARLMRPKNGDASCPLSWSTIAEGILRIDRFGLIGEAILGRSSVTRPAGSGRALLMRTN